MRDINKGDAITVFSVCLYNASAAEVAVLERGSPSATVSSC